MNSEMNEEKESINSAARRVSREVFSAITEGGFSTLQFMDKLGEEVKLREVEKKVADKPGFINTVKDLYINLYESPYRITKIQAIKLMRSVFEELDLRQLKELVESW